MARTKVCDSEWAAGTCGKVGRAARGGWRPAETNSDPSPQGQGQQNSDKEANLVAAQRSAEKCQMERGSRGGGLRHQQAHPFAATALPLALACAPFTGRHGLRGHLYQEALEFVKQPGGSLLLQGCEILQTV